MLKKIICVSRLSVLLPNFGSTTTTRIGSSSPLASNSDALEWLYLNHLRSLSNKNRTKQKILLISIFGTAFTYATIIVFEIRISLQSWTELTVAAWCAEISPTQPARTQWIPNRFAKSKSLCISKSYYLSSKPSFFARVSIQDEIWTQPIFDGWGKFVLSREISAVSI